MTIDFRTEPGQYKHWKIEIDGNVATLTMDVDEKGGLVPGYDLKLNSYDLGVDIELYDATQRLRFCHPEVGAVVITSGKDTFAGGMDLNIIARMKASAGVLFRCQHHHAGRVQPCPQSQLLQIHQ